MDENIKKPIAPKPRNIVEKGVPTTGYKIFCATLITAFFVVLILGALKITEMNNLIKAQELSLENKTGNIERLRINLNKAEKMYAHLQNKLDVVRVKEESGQRDLEAYILKKYNTVPKVVAKEVAVQVMRLTKEKGVPFSLIVGLIEVESQFKPWAISKKDARGLMQVMPWWITNKKANLGIKSKGDLHDIETNIKAGIAIFKIHLGEAKNDINKGLYLYVGKDSTYASKVFNAMGHFEIFRSTFGTAFRSEADQNTIKSAKARAKKERKG